MDPNQNSPQIIPNNMGKLTPTNEMLEDNKNLNETNEGGIEGNQIMGGIISVEIKGKPGTIPLQLKT